MLLSPIPAQNPHGHDMAASCVIKQVIITQTPFRNRSAFVPFFPLIIRYPYAHPHACLDLVTDHVDPHPQDRRMEAINPISVGASDRRVAREDNRSLSRPVLRPPPPDPIAISTATGFGPQFPDFQSSGQASECASLRNLSDILSIHVCHAQSTI